MSFMAQRFGPIRTTILLWTAAAAFLPGQGNPPGSPRFTDVTKAAGLNFRHVNGGSGKYLYLEEFGGGAAFFDYDGDGWMDIFMAQGAPLPGFTGPTPTGNVLYRNSGRGTFTDVTKDAGLSSTRYTLGVAAADFDNDGDTDLFITTLQGNVLYQNSGHGTFSDITARAGVAGRALSTSASFLDYDGDGWLDLFVVRYTDYSVATDPGCKGFTEREINQRRDSGKIRTTKCSPYDFAAVSNRLYHNERNGTFRDVSMSASISKALVHGFGVVTADFNEDGFTDIFVASDQLPNALFMNRGNGTFQERAGAAGVAVNQTGQAYGGMGVDAGDYDNDGHVDLFVTNFEFEPSSLYRNRGDGTFADEGGRSGISGFSLPFLKWGCRFMDVNGDGLLDLFVANGHLDDKADQPRPPNMFRPPSLGYAQTPQIYLNAGHGVFTDGSQAAGGVFLEKRVARGLAVADYDNDGDLDVLITANNQAPVLLRNEAPASQRWARIELQGQRCNRDAIGAVVRVTAGGITQSQTVKSGASYLSDHDRRLWFALPGTGAATAQIRWPCGATETANIVPGTPLKIVEKNCRLAR